MKKIFTSAVFISILSISNFANAQQIEAPLYIIGGYIESHENETSIELYRDDNNLFKTTSISSEGEFSLNQIPEGHYQLKIRRDGYEIYTETLSVTENLNIFITKQDLKTSSSKPHTTEIKDVVMTKKVTQPLIEKSEGKTIVNVESSIALSSGSVFEALEKSPGVKIDNNDNISYRGKGNILIQINGKNTSINGSELANYLKGMSVSNIDKIEFIPNPSAKYDASGTSIINIILKKNERRGTHISFSTTLGTGKLIKNSNNLAFNHRTERANYFFNYNFGYRKNFNHLVTQRTFLDQTGLFEKLYQQDNYLELEYRNHNVKAGMDYHLDDKNTLGIAVGYVGNNFSGDSENHTQVQNSTYVINQRLETTSSNRNNWQTSNINVNHTVKLDEDGSVLTTDLDYLRYDNSSLQHFISSRYNANNELDSFPSKLTGDIKGQLDFYSIKSDYRKNLSHNMSIEAGFKSSLVTSNNDLVFTDYTSGSPIIDATKTNHYLYRENINALYTNITKKWDKISATIGVRMENTRIKGEQLVDNTINERNYTQLFPSLVLHYKAAENHIIEWNFSRRITRPSYTELNPFKFYVDPTTYKVGNPDLEPQTFLNFDFSYTLNNKYTATFNYSRVKNNITTVLKPTIENGENVTVQTSQNLSSANFYSLNFSLPFKITKWWDMNNDVTLHYGEFTGEVSNTTINKKGGFTLVFNTINSFKMGNGFTSELTLNYQGKEQYAYINYQPQWFINIGTQKKFGAAHTLRLAFNDVLWRQYVHAQTNYTYYNEQFKVIRDTRQILLTYTYNLGANKTKSRNYGAVEDVQKRIGNG